MSESKNSKYIISERRFDSRDAALPPGVDPEIDHQHAVASQDPQPGRRGAQGLLVHRDRVDVAGRQRRLSRDRRAGSHAHDYDETLGFFGTDFADPYDLGGEIEFWIEDEKFLLTRSCLIFIPKGTYHCPLVIHRVDRPIFHFSGGPGGAYVQEMAEK